MGKETLAKEVLTSVELDGRLAEAEAMLRSPPPDVSEPEAEAFALRHYGRKVEACLLTGERDRNFLVRESAGWSAVLKFYNQADDAPARALQHGVLRHVHARNPLCPVPEIYLALNNQEEVVVERGGVATAAVMISRLPGVSPRAGDLSPALRAEIGRVVGGLSIALSDFQNPRSDRAILWDMMLVAELRPLAFLIDDADRRGRIVGWLDHFADRVRPATARLPHQAIHNDISLSNVLVDQTQRDRVTGIIDFGDIVRAPRINEFAVAASYFVASTDDPATAIAEILRSTDPGLRLLRDEVALMPELIKARLATRILLSGWRAQLFPGNRSYILRSNRAAWDMWERLEAEPAEALACRLMTLVDGVLL